MNDSLQYLAYLSRAKVKQLYEQVSHLRTKPRVMQDSEEGKASTITGADTFLGIVNPGLRIEMGRSFAMDTGHQTVIQQLQTVLSHIHDHERVLDLGKICREEAGVALDAFAYTYAGEFFAVAQLGRTSGKLLMNRTARSHGAAKKLVTDDFLLAPGLQENALKETGPNDGCLVSDIAILNSSAGNYTISLACSLKYFSDMGGNWDESEKEWHVTPHSGNYHFFDGKTGMWANALIFITGVRGKMIMGTPLLLAHASNPSLVI